MKIKEGKFYQDEAGRIYGPMLKRESLGAVFFIAPGHSYRWTREGKYFHSKVWFGALNHNHDLVKRVKFKMRRAG